MSEPAEQNLGDFIAIAKRRKWSMILSGLGLFSMAAILAFALPPSYLSTATILIEEQEMPKDFAISAVTSFAEQRIQSINQRIMSTTRLLEIINRFNLYPEKKSKWTTEEIVERMRKKDIKFQTINAEILDRRTGMPTKATIAFSLSFRADSPTRAQQVAGVLSSLYLEENMQSRARQAEGTSHFLEEEMKTVKGQIEMIDKQLVPFKAKYMNELPELLQMNMQALERCDRDIDRVRGDLRRAREREDYLRPQLAAINPDSGDQLLRELKARLVQLQSKFSDRYPDVIKTKREIKELEERGTVPSSGTDAKVTRSKGANGNRPDNPAYVTLASDLARAQGEIDSLNQELVVLTAQRKVYTRRIEATPRVEEQYKSLIMEQQSTNLKYNDLMRKLMEAKVSQGMEKEQMGERFTLIDPARLPERPASPNVPAILLIGLVLGIGTGIGTAALREFSDQSVRTPEQLATATQLPVLITIPQFVTAEETHYKKRKQRIILLAILAAIVVSIVAFHFLIMDLEILWMKVMRRFGV